MPDPLGLLQAFGQKVIWNTLKRVFGWLRRRLPVTRVKLDRRLAEATGPAGGSWEDRYRLSDVGNGTYVGVLRSGEGGEDDAHWICATCMDRGQRSVLNRYGESGSYNVWSCSPRRAAAVEALGACPEGSLGHAANWRCERRQNGPPPEVHNRNHDRNRRPEGAGAAAVLRHAKLFEQHTLGPH